MSSPTPLPTALEITTLPARAALRMPATPSTESRPEVHRVEEVVVDAPVDDVDLAVALGGAHVDGVVAAEQVTALDQLDAHLPGQQRVLEVGRVVDTRA